MESCPVWKVSRMTGHVRLSAEPNFWHRSQRNLHRSEETFTIEMMTLRGDTSEFNVMIIELVNYFVLPQRTKAFAILIEVKLGVGQRNGSISL